MTVQPAALVLADHYAFAAYGYQTTAPIRCACKWTGPACDHPAHLAEVLDRAGLLAPADKFCTDCMAEPAVPCPAHR